MNLLPYTWPKNNTLTVKWGYTLVCATIILKQWTSFKMKEQKQSNRIKFFIYTTIIYPDA